MKFQSLAAAVLPLALCGQAFAQDAAPPPAAPPAMVAPPMAPPAAPADAGVRIPAGSMIDLEILTPVSSEYSHLGDKVAIRLVGPVVVDGVVVIPAGTQGVAEVTSVKAAGMMSNGGELMLLARYLNVGDVQVPLRGLKMGIRGENNLFVAFVVAQAVGPFALFVKGGNVTFPAGTQAQAKIANDTVLVPAPVQPAQPSRPAQPAA